MPTEEKMTVNERRKYLKLMKPRYERAGRAERTHLLDEMEVVTGMHRKSLTRLLHEDSLERRPRRVQRVQSYGLEVERVVIRVWESLEYVCAERLTPALWPTAQHLARFGVLSLTTDLEEALQRISRATVERMLRKNRSRRTRFPQKGPERANQLTKAIPMGRIAWQTKEPGHCEVDLVHHSGESTAGEYLHTLQLIDVATGWSERVAVLGRSGRAMEAGFHVLLARVPFIIRELHPDNGSEFLNQHLVRFWGEQMTGLTLSRSRPSQKNDHRMVEQKNDSLVRQYFGHLRLDTPEHLQAMNALVSRRCGSITICSNQSCISVKKRSSTTRFIACGTKRKRLTNGYWRQERCLKSSTNACNSSLSEPIRICCANGSTRPSKLSGSSSA